MSVLDFLVAHPVDAVIREVTVSRRLEGHPFTVRAMTCEEFSEYARLATRQGRGMSTRFDLRAYQQAVVIGQTVSPCFKDEKAIRSAGCATPEQFLSRSLLAGEIAELAARIAEVSGFEGGLEETASEIKNA